MPDNPPANGQPHTDGDADDLIVIPARYGSTRLPGKPLLKISGRTLLERVVALAQEAARRAGACRVLVATDDDRIAHHAAEIGVDHALTAAELHSGTDRAFAAASGLAVRPTRVVNLQGDAPFIPPDIIAALIDALRANRAHVVTPVFQLSWDRLDRLREHKQSAPFSGTTCLRQAGGRALWFSKSILPAMRAEPQLRDGPMSPVWQHMGLYGYSMDALTWFSQTPPSLYETLEGLEQLRFLEGGWSIDTVAVEAPEQLLSGIDTPRDLALAEERISRLGDPFPE